LPFVFGVVAAWGPPEPWRSFVFQFTTLWGCVILLSPSGVRLSFRTPDGPTWSQMATMLALFSLDLGALVILWLGAPLLALAILPLAYALIFVLYRSLGGISTEIAELLEPAGVVGAE
jgi:hypothetical protein